MLRMSWECSGCNGEDEVYDPTDICGCCPRCHSHKGEVTYSCNMTIQEFLEELSNMSENDMIKNYIAIQECIKQFIETL